MSYVKGEVTYQIYFNQTNGYGVFKIEIDETNEPSFDFDKTCTITGYFKSLEVGGIYDFKGKMIFSNKYGYTFVAETYERILPKSKEGIIAYLSGESFKGIGKKTAELIVNTLGLDAIELIKEDKKVLDLVTSLNDTKKDVLYEAIVQNSGMEATLVTLYSYGITPKIALRIIKKYDSYALDVIKKNPYQLIEDIDGISFNKADQIALRTGIDIKSEMRMEACISYVLLSTCMETGDTYMDKTDLISLSLGYLNFESEDKEIIERCLVNLINKGKVVSFQNEVCDYNLYNAEKYIAHKLLKLNKKIEKRYFPEEIDKLIKNLETKLDIFYEEEQKTAIYSALKHNVSIITGGPGTGKTTIVRGILYVYRELISSESEAIKLCAPTGKAAKRIEESTGFEARTIHKLLGYDALGNFFYNKFNPLDAKLVIVDEASMVDTFLFERLLEALSDDTKIVIVGDYDQLPSIAPGQVLKDLIDSNCFQTTRLIKIHRQKRNSKIISLAYNVLEGQITTELDESHDELFFIPSSPENFPEILKNVIQHFMNEGYSIHQDIQVLIPIYKSRVGIDAANKYLQMTFNSNYNYETTIDENHFFLDDKVIQLANQYEDGVMNGDMGMVADILGEDEISVDFQGNTVKYKKQDAGNIQLAYAISVHKSQGSEFPVVIFPLFSAYKVLLNKKLIYTAITRAKEHLILIGSNRVLNEGLNINSKDRRTKLKSFL